MSPSVRAVVTGATAPAVALGRQGGRVLVGVLGSVPRASLDRATVSAVDAVSTVLDVLVPSVVGAVVSRLDLTAIVKEHVDLDEVVRDVDVDAIAGRLDISAVLDRMDLTALVRERVDLDAVVREVDIDAIAARLDLDTVAARLDVDAVAARLDIDAVIARIDLVGIAQEVMDALDLPAIIRGSTMSVASESVQDVRLQSIAADEAVSRVMDRLLLRRRHRAAAVNGAAPDPAAAAEAIPGQRDDTVQAPQP